MGAWGAGPFENDDASDWVYELEKADSAAVVREPLDIVDVDYLEAPDGVVAVVAAEVVAAALGQPRASLPESVTTWVAAHSTTFTTDDARAAIAAIDRVRGDGSETRELWEESGIDEWQEHVAELSAPP